MGNTNVLIRQRRQLQFVVQLFQGLLQKLNILFRLYEPEIIIWLVANYLKNFDNLVVDTQANGLFVFRLGHCHLWRRHRVAALAFEQNWVCQRTCALFNQFRNDAAIAPHISLEIV